MDARALPEKRKSNAMIEFQINTGKIKSHSAT